MKTTQKAVKNRFSIVVPVPYCELQVLLRHLSPFAHTERAEGWGADVYNIGGGVAIATGYAPFGNVKLPHDRLEAYEQKATEIYKKYALSYNDIAKKLELEELIDQFIAEAYET